MGTQPGFLASMLWIISGTIWINLDRTTVYVYSCLPIAVAFAVEFIDHLLLIWLHEPIADLS
ncbi:hypothetical protein [Thalassoporum mexicanum]|uniref:hypothetical protein n=1 Tax=Thalassoporum mexicanum TaxID=3457544 RepID=UPI0005A1649D|nr:hypothetical protein [Pseudanabaena sp. PCC 7367]